MNTRDDDDVDAHRLRLIADDLPALICYVDRDRRYRYNNRAYLEWFGYRPEQLYGRHIAEVIGDAAYATVRPHIDAALEGRAVSTAATLHYRHGGPRHVQVHYLPDVRGGRVHGYVALITDTSEWRQTEAQIAALNSELRGRLEELQTIMNVSPVGVFVASDPACTHITMNPAGAAMLRIPLDANASLTGTPPGALPFRVFKDGTLVDGPDLPMQRAARTGSAVMGEEVDVVFADGQVTTLYEYALPLFDETGGVRGCVGLFVDITPRKQTEAALAESETRFRQVAEVTAQFIWVISADGSAEYFNQRWLDYSGLDRATAGNPDRVASSIHPDDRDALLARWQTAFATGGDFEVEARLRRHDGAYRWFLVRSVPFRDAAGHILKWFGTSTDIHDRKLQEADARFLGDLSEQIRLSDDSAELLSTVADQVGRHLEAARCFFTEIDHAANRWFVRREYRGAPHRAPLVGMHQLSDYPAGLLDWLRAGHTGRVNETETHPMTAAAYPTRYGPAAMRALLAVPLLRSSERVSSLVIAHDHPHDWTDREVAMAETVAERAWNAAEKLQLHASLRRSEETLQAALSGGGLGAWSWDPARNVVAADARVLELLGLDPTRPRLTLSEILETVHPDDVAAVRASLARAEQHGGEHNVEFRITLPSGEQRWIGGAGRGRFDAEGRLLQVYGVNFDITERKRGELHTRFLLEFDAALAQLTTADEIEEAATRLLAVHLHLDRCNLVQIRGGTAIIGREFRRVGDSVIGEHDFRGFLSPAQAEDFGRGAPLVVHDVAGDPRTAPVAEAYLRVAMAAYVGIPLQYGQRVVGSLTCGSAVRRHWRDDEVQTIRDVAARVWPRIEQARAAQAMRDADRRKDEFLAMLAHELRNPLAPIRSAAEVLKMPSQSDANQRWAREVIERQTQHLTRLVDDLLDVSRITSGKVTLQREPVELSVVVQRAIETTRGLIDGRRHDLRVTMPGTPLRVEGDLTRLVQVLGNLLNNAAKYTDEGGRIQLEVQREGAMAAMRVRDNGIGIAPELLPHVFDLFTQASRSLDRSQGGLGIGLTLARQLVELHGGTVDARSGGPGQGSEFIVRLPALAAEPLMRVEHPMTEARPVGTGLRVLVVEDNEDAAEMMAFLLQASGHQVAVAADAIAALDTAGAFHPDVILCDIGLPGMNGYELAQRLRTLPQLAGTRLIALTGYGQEEDRRRAREAGFDHHLIKPVEPRTLETLLAGLVPNR